jgi:phosphatidylglycerophosphatase A
MNPSPDAAADPGKPSAEKPDTEKKNPPRAALLFATAFGLGYLPMAPGTWGSLAGVALAYLLGAHPQRYIQLGGLVFPAYSPNFWLLLLSLAGVLAAAKVAEYLGTHDPQIVVVDEVSGQWLALAASPALLLRPALQSGTVNWKYFLLGFILFRVFDIWKPFPVNRAEALPGGWGIMADDWVAGLYAAACLWLARGIGL